MNIIGRLFPAAAMLLSFMLMMVSCVSENREISEGTIEETISVCAGISPNLHSRTYFEQGYVDEGTFYLTYQSTTANSYGVADVNFGSDSGDPRIGYVDNGDPNKKFTWDMIGGQEPPTFYLDNVRQNPSASSNSTVVTFSDTYNPFIAGVFDLDGMNDLLWGDKQVAKKSTNTLNFDLHHNMSRIRLQITVDKTYEQQEGDLDLETAKVYITNINQKPLSYNRLDGSLTLEPEDNLEAYTDLYFVDENIEWGSAVPDETDPNVTVYTTRDFVVPPQNLLDDANRPRLIIEFESGKVFSGVIPHAMLVTDASHPDELSYPLTLEFLKEHILLIRTKVTETPPTMEFLPVYIYEWVDKGEYTVEGHQAGLYTATEFYNMIEYFQEQNDYQLTRYGKLRGNLWIFDIFESFILDYEKIYNQINLNESEYDFSFSSHNYTIFVRKGTQTESVTMTQLHDILTGQNSAPF